MWLGGAEPETRRMKMPGMNGVEPTDLPKKTVTWSQWPLADRITAARSIPGYTTEELQSAVAITLNEQSGNIPVNNCCGLMCLGKSRPWAWTDVWENHPPTGYALINEGQTGLVGVFFAFDNAADSLLFLVKKVRSRGLTTPEVYADKWVGGGAQTAGAIAGFKSALKKVQANWGTGVPAATPPDVTRQMPALARGATGEDVVTLQRLLTNCGYPVPDTGKFLAKTEAAVMNFQRANKDENGKPLSVDGTVGKNTWWSLTHHGT
jgi:hypothetical protein